MKSRRVIISLVAIIVSLLFNSVFSGWTEDMRITDRGYEIYPQIIVRNDTLHVAWQQVAGDDLVSYMRSLDGGATWEEIVDLTEDNHRGVWVDLTLSGNRIMAGWWDIEPVYPNDQLQNIAFRISEGGEEWPLPEYIYGPDFEGIYAVATTFNGDSIYAAYQAREHDSTGYYPIIFLYSGDDGATWSDEQVVGYIYSNTNGMLIKKCGASVLIVWTATPVPELQSYEAMAVVSGDGGQTWSERMMLSGFGSPTAQLPCMSCNRSNDEIAVGWMDYSYPGDLFIRISADGGYSWEPEIHVTDHHAISEPNIEFVGDTLWAVWEDFSFANQRELGFRKSIDRGQNWSPIERLTFAEGNSHRPWLSYDAGKLHLVWDEVSRPPYYGIDIYYKRYEPEVGISDDDKCDIMSLLYSYPNPFNSTTTISYSNAKGGDIEIYDITGRLVKRLNVRGEEGKIAWDATDATGEKVCSGTYFARINVCNNKAIKLVYLK
jgi:hypothetical protein